MHEATNAQMRSGHSRSNHARGPVKISNTGQFSQNSSHTQGRRKTIRRAVENKTTAEPNQSARRYRKASRRGCHGLDPTGSRKKQYSDLFTRAGLTRCSYGIVICCPQRKSPLKNTIGSCGLSNVRPQFDRRHTERCFANCPFVTHAGAACYDQVARHSSSTVFLLCSLVR
jgi:hypothetical protein